MGAARSGEKMYIGLSGINKNESMGKKRQQVVTRDRIKK
jgi:hypothetical protein